MGIVRGLLGGFAVSGVCVFAYQQRIFDTSAHLQRALSSLTKDLDGLRSNTSTESEQDVEHLYRYAPFNRQDLPITQQAKVQWNQQLLYGIDTLYTTQWSTVASRAWTAAKNEAAAIQARLQG